MSEDKYDLKKIISELEQEKKKLNIITSLSANLIFEYDSKEKSMKYTNQNTDWMPNPVVNGCGKYFLEGVEVWYEDLEIAEQFYRDLETGIEFVFAEFRIQFSEGQSRYIEIKGKTIYDENGAPQMVLGRVADINERKQKELILEKLSKIDCLTDLYNKKTVKNRIVSALEQAERKKAKALFIIDIDFFKEINDSYGHLFGDAVLCSVSDEMKHVFSKEAILGRIGGDEFIAYAEGVTLHTVKEYADNLCHNIRSIYEKKEEESKIKISCSIGISISEEETKDYETMFQEADQALYYRKNAGKGSYEIYDGSDKYDQNYLSNLRELLEYGNQPEEACETNHGMHMLLLFSIELLEKVKESQNAIQMILDRVGRYFSLDEIILLVSNEKGITEAKFQWIKKGRNSFRARRIAYSFQQAESILSCYDEFGLAVLHKEDLQIEGVFEPDMESILTVRGNLDEFKMGDIAFMDTVKNRVWTVEEKTVIRGLATIFYTYLSKINAIETTKKAEYLLHFDSVTGLPNYGTFKELVEDVTMENAKMPFMITYSGFSNFQYVNDTFGYSVGDAVLTRFGKMLQEKCASQVCCGRITGDQFVTLHRGADLEQIRNEYIAVCKYFCKIMEIEIGIVNLTIYSGIAKLERTGNHQVASTIDHANLARKMVRGKAETDCLAFTTKLKQTIDDRIKITSTMSTALEKEEFKVYLQPKSDLHTGEIIGAEALVRWQKQDGSMIYPDEFIPIFEENGFVTQIDFYVLQRVLIYLKERMKKGLAIVPISVNFSRRHQENPDFVSDIIAMLDEYGLPRSCIEVEVTESVFMSNLDILHSSMKKLKENGILISIDDFGSGYSSLNVLASVPADIIKIDRLFLQDNQEKNIKILQYLIAMIKSLGFQVIVEGVETKEQVKMLMKTKCDMIQGFFFAKPMPMNEFSELF